MNIRIDLFSDTVTRPTPEMRAAISNAEVGDDMSGLDPTVNRLEAMAMEMFDKEAAVFACSGTQSNQMAVRAHCRPGDELLINETGHIANYEGGGAAVLSGVSAKTLHNDRGDGMLDVDDLKGQIRANDQHLSPTRLLCIENTTNAGGGKAYTLDHIARVGEWAHSNGLKVHMDGARLFNATVARGYSPADLTQHVDSISICFSKGLGCPMGSILVGSADVIAHARRSRKLFGGAMRQSGIVAAAAIYAFENNIERLADDHANARYLAERLAEVEGISINPGEVESNLVFFNIDPALGTASEFGARTAARGIRVCPIGGTHRVRVCTHLDISRGQIDEAVPILAQALHASPDESSGKSEGPY